MSNIIIAAILGFLGLGTATGRAVVTMTLNEANIIWLRLVRIYVRMVTFLIILGAIGIIATTNGYGWINLVLMLLVLLSIPVVFSNPDYIAAVGATGAVIETLRNAGTLTTGAEKFLKGYGSLFKQTMVWVALIFLGMFLLNFKENPGAVLPIVCLLAFLGLSAWAWKIEGKIWKNLVRGIAIVALLYFVATLIPDEYYARYTPINPTLVRPSSRDRAVIDAENAHVKMIRKGAETRLKDITHRLETGGPMSADDFEFLHNEGVQLEKRKLF